MQGAQVCGSPFPTGCTVERSLRLEFLILLFQNKRIEIIKRKCPKSNLTAKKSENRQRTQRLIRCYLSL